MTRDIYLVATSLLCVCNLFLGGYSSAQSPPKSVIDAYFDEKLESFKKVISDSKCSYIIEGKVMDVKLVPYYGSEPYAVSSPRWHIGRQITIEVSHSWKRDKKGVTVIYTHGGILNPEEYQKDALYPIGCGSSTDVKLDKGESIIIAVTEEYKDMPYPAWTFGQSSGKVSLDLKCEAFKSEKEKQAFDPEGLKYLEQKKEEFILDVYGALSDFQKF